MAMVFGSFVSGVVLLANGHTLYGVICIVLGVFLLALVIAEKVLKKRVAKRGSASSGSGDNDNCRNRSNRRAEL